MAVWYYGVASGEMYVLSAKLLHLSAYNYYQNLGELCAVVPLIFWYPDI